MFTTATGQVTSTPHRLSLADLRSPAGLLAFGFGSGLAPRAPGTFGTLAGLPVYALLTLLSPWPYAAVVLILFIIGIWCCQVTTDRLGVHDHGAIVWDEIVGLQIALFLLPAGFLSVMLGLLYFRLFDILKPWPIGWIDKRLHGGIGIMMDDVIAGVFACLSAHATLLWVVPVLVALFEA